MAAGVHVVAPPLHQATAYDVIEYPPLLDGAAHERLTAPNELVVADNDKGADAVVAGVAETTPACELPAPVVAMTSI